MSPTKAGRDQRALLTGAGVIAAIVIFARVVPLLRTWSDASVLSAREIVDEAVRSRQRIARDSSARAMLAERRRRLTELAPALFAGTATAAAAALASHVTDVAHNTNVRLGAIQVRSDTSSRATGADILSPVSVRAELTADVRGLAMFLLALEEGPQFLAIRELSVTQPEPGGPSGRPEILRVEIVIEGLALAQDTVRG